MTPTALLPIQHVKRFGFRQAPHVIAFIHQDFDRSRALRAICASRIIIGYSRSARYSEQAATTVQTSTRSEQTGGNTSDSPKVDPTAYGRPLCTCTLYFLSPCNVKEFASDRTAKKAEEMYIFPAFPRQRFSLLYLICTFKWI